MLNCSFLYLISIHFSYCSTNGLAAVLNKQDQSWWLLKILILDIKVKINLKLTQSKTNKQISKLWSQSSTLSARMLTSSESQWPFGQKGRLMSRAFTIFTKLVMTWIVEQTHGQAPSRINLFHTFFKIIRRNKVYSTSRILKDSALLCICCSTW